MLCDRTDRNEGSCAADYRRLLIGLVGTAIATFLSFVGP